MYKLLIFIFLSNIAIAQNLVENNSFEKITNNKLLNWKFDWFADVCSTNSKQWEYNCYGCPVSKFGKNFLKFTYSNIDSMKIRLEDKKEPCSSGYAKIKLNKTMEIAKIYEIKLWVYFPKEQIIDTLLPYHFGFCFFNKDFIRNKFWLRNSPFKVYDLKYDIWYEQIWYIKPTCELNYIEIGLFKDESWPLKEKIENHVIRIYVDNITIEEVKNTDINYINYCSLPDNLLMENKSTFDSLEIFFNINDSSIGVHYKPILDSITNLAIKYPKLVFEIEGYTDDLGSNHIELSKKRVDAVINYLNYNGIDKNRFIPKYFGNIEKSNGNYAIKMKNRKAIIKKSKTRLDQVFYNMALKNSNIDTTFKYLKKWHFLTQDKMKIFALFDTRLDQYHAT